MRAPISVLLAICTCAFGCTLGMSGCTEPGLGGASAATIALSPSSGTVNTGQQLQFTVSLNGIVVATGINWFVNGVVGGNTTVGTISGSGLYTAPTSVPNPNVVTVSASQQGSTGLQLTASVTIVGSEAATPSASISVSPSTIASGTCAQLSWSSGNVNTCTVNGSSVNVSGSMTVCPVQTTSYTFDCTGPNGEASDTATLNVQTSTAIPTVSITPETATLASGATIQFTGSITNDPSNEGLAWSSSLAPAPVVTAGSGTLTATWTAPCVTQNTMVTIIDASVADANVRATATITVTPPASGSCGGSGGNGGGTGNCTSPPPSANPPQVGISPSIVNLIGGETQNFTAALTGDNVSSQAFTWSLTSNTPATEGTIVSTGPNSATYTAANPSQLTAVGVVATSSEYTCFSASATVEIAPNNNQ